jgi:nucleoside-diphosphate-sugar epimerase
MKIVVTGGAGKLGQYVVHALLDSTREHEAHTVTVLDQVRADVPTGVRMIVGDVLDLGQVIGVLAGADAVIHLAGIPAPWTMPDDVVFRTNTVATFNIHEAAARLGIRRVVTASSEAVVGWTYRRKDFLPDYLPIDENHPLRPQDPYGLSKAAGEAIARSYSDGHGMETIAIRPPWVCSPEELDAVRKQGGRKVMGFQLFNYVDVRDLAEAFRLAVERPIKGHVALHVTSDDASAAEPLNELLPRLYPEIGDLAKNLTGSRPAASNVRAKEVLGWQPRYSWRHCGVGA